MKCVSVDQEHVQVSLTDNEALRDLHFSSCVSGAIYRPERLLQLQSFWVFNGTLYWIKRQITKHKGFNFSQKR